MRVFWWCSLLLVVSVDAFSGFATLSSNDGCGNGFQRRHGRLSATRESEPQHVNCLDVVLFGVGDLRTRDHGGLANALANAASSTTRLLPLCILDETSLSRIPGAMSHTVDTARLLEAALVDLNQNLLQKWQLPLHVDCQSKTVSDALQKVVLQCNAETVRVHVCDLGDADNNMGYGPYGNLQQQGDDSFQVVPWSCPLLEEPWKDLERSKQTMVTTYPEYKQKYSRSRPLKPFAYKTQQQSYKTVRIQSLLQLPDAQQIASAIPTHQDESYLQAEINTGLYATHWGGLHPSTVGESVVQDCLDAYTQDCAEDQEAWVQHPKYDVSRKCRRNGRSLEHASVVWMLRGDGSKPTPETNNIMDGETMTRFLAAPLWLGTTSARIVWQATQRESNLFYENPLRAMVHGAEWHKVLAARNIRVDPAYQNSPRGSSIQYGYWRWHGFLCRYVVASMKASSPQPTKNGILLIHGFGASGSQWIKMLNALGQQPQSDVVEGLAPDLIGFGQSEKPPLTYTSYMWEGFVADFAKDVAVARQKWGNFVVGGNSIGGFVSMASAANDRAQPQERTVSAIGTPGTGLCTGLVLMNSAGPGKTREEVEAAQRNNQGELQRESVAQVTAIDGLPSCRPFPRPVAKALGNVLLAYLRPRIQSICVNLYPTNPAAVDDELCEGILRDSLDPGAIHVMMSGTKLPAARTINEILAADFGGAPDSDSVGAVPESQWDGPVLVANGLLDPLNDLKARTALFGSLRKGIAIDSVDAGHCPHDELPEVVASKITKWLLHTKEERSALVKSSARTSAVA